MRAGHFVRTYEHWREELDYDNRDPVTGEAPRTWTKKGDILGRAYPASTRDTIASGRPVGLITWTFACSPCEDIQPGDEIRFDDRRVEVLVVPVTSSGRRCECQCQEVQ